MESEHRLVIISLVVHLLVLAFAIREVWIHLKKTRALAYKSEPYRFNPSLTLLLSILLLGIVWIVPGVPQLISSHGRFLFKGIFTTLEVSLLSVIIGTLIGVAIAALLARPKRRAALWLLDSLLLSGINNLIGVPALVLVYLCFYQGLFPIGPFWASVLALSINLAPFVARIVLASVGNISREQMDSALSFGYTRWQRFWYFEVLFVIKNAGQSLLVEYYTTIKLSSFAGLIGVQEIFKNAKDINTEVLEPYSVYTVMAVCYVAIIIGIAALADFLATRWKPIND